MKKRINIVLNCIIVILVLALFIGGFEFYKYYSDDSIKYESIDLTKYMDLNIFDNNNKNSIDIDGVKVNVNLSNNSSYMIPWFYRLDNEIIPSFEGNNIPKISIDISYDTDPFYENVILKYKNKKINITNKLKISNNKIIYLKDLNSLEFSSTVVFPYKNDVYMLAPISTVANLNKNVSEYEYNRDNTMYGCNPSDGIVEYGLINLTSNKKTKIIKINTITSKNNISENKYVKDMHNSNINVYDCFEVKDNIQIVLNSINDIKNTKVRNIIFNNIKEQYSNIPKDKKIILSINKKDFNKFLNALSGGK